MEEHYFSTSHPHSNNSNSNQYAFTVTTPSSINHSESGPLQSPGSFLASANFASALSATFNFSNSNQQHSLYQTDEKKQQHSTRMQQNHPYPPSSMLSPLSPHLGLGSPASTRGTSSDLEDDIQRKRANRLSLASSIASSAPSTSASEVDGSEEGNDYEMGEGQYLNFCDAQQPQQQQQQNGGIMEGKDTEMSSIGRSRGSTLSDAFRFQNGDRVPDLVHSRSNATIQARYQNGDRSPLMSPSECTSSHSNVAEFVFSDFIADAEQEGLGGEGQGGGADDQDLQRTVDGAQALSLYSSPVQQSDSFATPQRPLRHRDVSHLSVGESSTSSYHFNGMQHQHQQHSHAFNSCPTSPASPLTPLPATSFETPQASGSIHYNHSMGGAPSAAAAYAALHRPPFGNGGRSFSFNVIPAHQDQNAMSGVVHDPHGLFSDRGVVGGSGDGNEGAAGAHRASEGGNNFGPAGLGLFGYAQSRPDSLGRSHSLPGPIFVNNEPLSCNPAHITPSASSRSGYGTDNSVVSSPAGSLNVSSMVFLDSDGADSPISPYAFSTNDSPRDLQDDSDGEDGEEDMEDRQNTIKSPPTKKQLLKGGNGEYLASSPSKSSNLRISAKRLFSSTTEDEDRSMSTLSSSAPSAPAAISSASSIKRTPSTSRSARGTRRSNGLTINSSRSRSPAGGSASGSPSSAGIYHSSHASPYLSPSTINYGKIRSVSSSNLPRSPLAGTPASPAESVISAFSSRSSYHSGQEDNSSVSGTPSSSLASASINAEGVITKRSRGRRVPDDPSELNNLGKMGKIYTCQVEGCGKCFKRSEHLKRHVRSIHTDEKPFECPYPTCHKKFSRLDNLNQHSRVHQVPTSGASSTGSVSARSSQAGSVSPAFSPHIPSSNSGNSMTSASSGGGSGGRRGSAPSSISIKMVGSSSSEGGSGGQIKRKRGSASLNKEKANQVKQQQEEEEGMFALDEEQEDSNADVKPLNLNLRR